MISAADRRREHAEAILSLNDKQRRAFNRILEMKKLGPGLTQDEKLNIVCEREVEKLGELGRPNPLDAVFRPLVACDPLGETSPIA